MPYKKVPTTFFNRSAVIVAKELIGCVLVRKSGAQVERYVITETEAYEGPYDQASHAFRGRTPRSEVMFGKPGIIYVYLIYGMHYMLNIVTGKKDHPGAVLIRGVSGYAGPGKVTKLLHIDKTLNTKPLGTTTHLWIEFPPTPFSQKILRTPRIGIDYAGDVWKNKKYRFALSQ